MPLRPSKGNMYDWVTHTHSHLGGECPHKCIYCYVDNPKFGGRPEKYQGEPGLIEKEFEVEYGAGKVIFVENMNDLFADGIPDSFITRVMLHCWKWPDNQYVFQTKNPARYLTTRSLLPPNSMRGCTIETNKPIGPAISHAPLPVERFLAMEALEGRKFITVEPVLDFDLEIFAERIIMVRPDFVNVGADSKGRNLPEPSIDEVMKLVELLTDAGIEVREKHNLERLKNNA